MNALRATALIVSVFLFPAIANAGVITVETASLWNGTDSVRPLVQGTATSTYGQTFRVPVPARLFSWSFFMRGTGSGRDPDPLFADFYLAEWSGDRATSPELFRASKLRVPASMRGEFLELRIDVPDVLLTPSIQYVAFLNASPYGPAPNGHDFPTAEMGHTRAGYADGDFWFQRSNNLSSNVFGFPWECGNEGSGCRYGDAAFIARFREVPEPNGMLLPFLALLSASVVGWGRRARSRSSRSAKPRLDARRALAGSP